LRGVKRLSQATAQYFPTASVTRYFDSALQRPRALAMSVLGFRLGSRCGLVFNVAALAADTLSLAFSRAGQNGFWEAQVSTAVGAFVTVVTDHRGKSFTEISASMSIGNSQSFLVSAY